MAVTRENLYVIEVDPVERHLFLEGVFLRYGYDFRQYSEASLTRRLSDILFRYNQISLIEILKQVLTSPDFFREILPYLTIGTTEFFRDPLFFRTLREQVFPILKTYPTVKIWNAGCSTGEEVLSMAIALKEEGLYDRSTIYATDINPKVLKQAREGIYDLHSLETFTKNYTIAGGKCSPSEYFTADYGLARFDPDLRRNVVFSEHNLVTDSVFCEAHLILCRNVIIYFNRELQQRVFRLFFNSLAYRGFLGIGSKESIRFSGVSQHFSPLVTHQNIFQRNLPVSNQQNEIA